jgi:hypothetical protein
MGRIWNAGYSAVLKDLPAKTSASVELAEGTYHYSDGGSNIFDFSVDGSGNVSEDVSYANGESLSLTVDGFRVHVNNNLDSLFRIFCNSRGYVIKDIYWKQQADLDLMPGTYVIAQGGNSTFEFTVDPEGNFSVDAEVAKFIEIN